MRLLAGGLALALAGCGGIAVPAGKRAVRVDTENVSGANCTGEGKDGVRYFWRDTPALIAVRERAFPFVLICEKPGYKKAAVIVDERSLDIPEDAPFMVQLQRGMKKMVRTATPGPKGEDAVILVRVPMERAGR
ncbi:MAG: hypothetical protein O2807_01490 [bacterium]|nr:hypothetical protein [bacterium]